ncbi:MAG TPA: GNVR domain-containing protein [Sphingobium sp.]|nr:GNVR domain-containing protein [Sphingobium sp.]
MNNMQVHQAIPDDGGSASFIPYLPSIILRRKWVVIVPALLGIIIGLAAAFLLPVKYQSRAVLLVEASLLPDDVTLDTNSAQLVDQRMARIRQQVLSRPQLFELIQRNGLYDTELRTKSLSQVIETMRAAIKIDPVTADIQTTNSGRRTTIAFSMSFLYSDPIKAQAVTQALTEQVLELDASKSATQATNTVEFLTDQASDLQTQISAVQQQLSDIKARNGLALIPGIGMMSGSTGGIDAQVAALQSANAQLIAQRDLTKSAAERDPVVSNAESQLAIAQATYADTHPDVILAKQRLAEARELAKSNQQKIPLSTIDAQIAGNNRQIAALQAVRNNEANRSSALMDAQMRGPVLQQQIAQLEQRLTGLNGQYQGVSNQLLAAKAGKKAEDEQQGERLSIIDPPVVPDKPVSPNRPMIIALASMAGLGLGLGIILLIELITKPIRNANAVAAATGELPLVVIPTIISAEDRKRKGLGSLKALWPFGGNDDDDDDEDGEGDTNARRGK